jgi:hypothetical protein
MFKVFHVTPRRAAMFATLGAALALPLMISTPAEAWWRGGGGWGWHGGGWCCHSGVSIGIGLPLVAPGYYGPPPPVYYAPPPVVYAAPPPPVVYAQPGYGYAQPQQPSYGYAQPQPRVVYAQPPQRAWEPGYWRGGVWIEGHWR